MLRRMLPALVACAVAAPFLQLVAPVVTVSADAGLRIRSTTTYTIDPVAGVVDVVAEVTLTNTVPDEQTPSGTRRFFYSGFSVPAPAGALGATARTTTGRELAVTERFLEGNLDYYLIEVDFGRDIFNGESISIVVAYQVTGLPPRSANPSRVNAAYASFTAFGVGDDGLVTVRVRAPFGFEVETFGDDTSTSVEDGYTVYTASDIADPDEFSVFVSARNDAALVTTDVSTADGDRFDVRAWPDDPEWTEFVRATIIDGIPVLGELIGAPWPIEGTVDVRQAFTPYLYGYAGWFSAANREIEIGEDLDRDVVLHELSHAWFNSTWFADRWINEGLAQAYAQRAGAALGDTTATSEPPGAVAFPLNEWDGPDFVEGADESEEYGYAASWWLVDQLVGEVGLDRMREVLSAADERTIAYRGDLPPETDVRYSGNWKTLLDLFEEVAGSTQASDLFERYVVADADAELLAARAEARVAYRSLHAAGGEWAPPPAVRHKMAVWSFDTATELIDAAEIVLDARDRLQPLSDELGVAVPAALEEQYEAAAEDLAAVEASVNDQLDAAQTLLAAVRADAADDGLFAQIGLIGTDADSLLEEGRAALSSGDTETARAKAQEVTRLLERAPDIGKERSLKVGGAAFVLVLLVVTLAALLIRRRRDRAAVAAGEPTVAADSGSDPGLLVWVDPSRIDDEPDGSNDGNDGGGGSGDGGSDGDGGGGGSSGD